MEIIAVSDTNIFINLIEIDLLDEFFALPWKIHTTDMIIHGLKVIEQKKKVKDYQTRGKLRVKGYDTKEMLTLTKFHTLQRETTKVSIQDCSGWLYAMDNGYTLLTGDAKLKDAATKTGVDVQGMIYVIDKFVDMPQISKDVAADKLEELLLLNQKLPMSEIDRRVKLWRGNKKEDAYEEVILTIKKPRHLAMGGASARSRILGWRLHANLSDGDEFALQRYEKISLQASSELTNSPYLGNFS